MSKLEIKQIKDCPDYGITKVGDVYSMKRGEPFKMTPNVFQGYHRIKMMKPDGTVRNAQIHRLVAEAFLKKPKGMDIVNHIDGDKSNNKVDNLEWTNSRGNAKHYTETILPNKKISRFKAKQDKLNAKINVAIYAYNEFKDFPEEFYNTFGQIFQSQ